MAAAVEVPAGWTPPAYDKTDSEAAFLKETIETNRLMKNLEPSDREQARRRCRHRYLHHLHHLHRHLHLRLHHARHHHRLRHLL